MLWTIWADGKDFCVTLRSKYVSFRGSRLSNVARQPVMNLFGVNGRSLIFFGTLIAAG